MIGKVKSFINENKYILLAGLGAAVVMLSLYIIFQITPFGDNTIYKSDLYHQYGPLFTELYDRLSSGESLVYSWNSGLGGPFIGNFFNYLSSPFGFLVLLFEHNGTFDAVAIMIFAKAVLCSTSMAYYLKKSQKYDGPMLIAFGVMYAFTAYFIAYYWNIMWMDSLYLFPLVILGIEKIINSGKCANYIAALATTMITSYYIAYMVCIFACLYFIYYYICSKEKLSYKRDVLDYKKDQNGKIKNSFFLQSGIRFALSSVAAATLALWVFLPVAHVLASSSATSFELEDAQGFKLDTYFNIFDFLANHLAATTPTFRSNGDHDILPNVYSGILTLFLIPLYLISKKIPKREKIASVGLLSILFISFNINLLDFVWHGFHYPNDIPYRQSFMYSFILLILAFKAYKYIDDFDKKTIGIIGGGIVAFTAIVAIVTSPYVTTKTIVFSIIMTVLFTVVLLLIKFHEHLKRILSIVLVCLVLVEPAVSIGMLFGVLATKSEFTLDYGNFKVIQNQTESGDTDPFYRTEITRYRTRMESCWYDFNGASTFTSMAYQNVANLQRNLGVHSNTVNSYTYHPQTPVYNSMFAIKYLYDYKGEIKESKYYTQKGVSTFFAYENNYHLPLAYCVSDNVTDWNASSYDNGIEAQEEYFNSATGISDIYTDILDYDIEFQNSQLVTGVSNRETGKLKFIKTDPKVAGDVTFDVPVSKDGNYYLYIRTDGVDTTSIYSKTLELTIDESNQGYILDLGQHTVGDKISLKSTIGGNFAYANIDFRVFTIDDEKFVEGYNQLKEGQITLTRFEETEISGTFTAEENEILYTSIPYDKGWSVELDGKKLDDDQIVVISDALLGVKVSAGEHNITFRYAIPGMAASNIISIGFALLLIVLYILNKKNLLFFKNKKENLWLRAEGELPQETTDVDTVVETIEKPEAPQQKKTNTQATPKKKKRKKRH